jgi:formylglycine-generating enzyme required for sulfatase activity
MPELGTSGSVGALGRKPGGHPTARAGTATANYWGAEVGRGHANCNGCGSQWDNKQTSPVGSFAANPWGVFDMAGTVWEYTQDCWHGNYNGAPTDGTAWQAGSDCTHVVRGGSWTDNTRLVRSACRNSIINYGNGWVGLRLARTP